MSESHSDHSDHSDHADHADHADAPHGDHHNDFPHGDATPGPHLDLSHLDLGHGDTHHLDWPYLDTHSDHIHEDFGPPTTDPLDRFARRMVGLLEGIESRVSTSHKVLFEGVAQGVGSLAGSLEELRRRVEALEKARRGAGDPEETKRG